MAIGRISVKVGKRGDTGENGNIGRGLAHANYILGIDKYASKDDEVLHVEHRNMPSFAKDNPLSFWQSADEFERQNGSIYREHIFSLPRELTFEQNKQLVDDWVKQEIDDKHALTLAIHEVNASDGKPQTHCHLMFSERINDNIERTAEQYFKRYNSKNPERGGAKKASGGKEQKQRKQELLEQRQRWGDMLNKHLRRHGFNADIDMRSSYHRKKDKQTEPQRPINLLPWEFEQRKQDFLNSRVADIAPLFIIEKHDDINTKVRIDNAFVRLLNNDIRTAYSELVTKTERRPVNSVEQMTKLQRDIYNVVFNDRDRFNNRIASISKGNAVMYDYATLTLKDFCDKHDITPVLPKLTQQEKEQIKAGRPQGSNEHIKPKPQYQQGWGYLQRDDIKEQIMQQAPKPPRPRF